ncbi:MAG: nucleotidyltransferase family protein [Candidatus Manganitrophus sp. SA1]|nr:nucleotidyltransferase family protein [Candidatus Manganitrophus morganii]
MDDPDDRQGFSRNPTVDDLVQLCKSLNEAGVRYVVVGGFAVAHHGYIRTTGDIDLLIDASTDNVEKVRKALSYLPDKAVLEVNPTDVQNYTVVRVADEVIVDLLEKACGLTLDQVDDIDSAEIQGVKIPYAGIRSLIKTKQSIRPKDVIDRSFLEEKLKQSGDKES